MKEMPRSRRCRRRGKWGPSMWCRAQQQQRQQQRILAQLQWAQFMLQRLQQQLLSAQVSQVRFQQYHHAGGAVFLATQRMNPHTVKSASCTAWGRPTPLSV
ncbi:hypothetical protein TRSC58_07220 [Trypanosoma rangeli SC58]|uniref:Uncharacterized protein n=1 Tax=Trypanosoma rangeli SC58 TaxID=429131 RepID=A0A061ITP2_TRYRA|nr:hypothetical protein TRSC58_07220 [Trypanosoma rangeli SC58]